MTLDSKSETSKKKVIKLIPAVNDFVIKRRGDSEHKKGNKLNQFKRNCKFLPKIMSFTGLPFLL
jgi:hypothetical protein